MVKGVSRRVIVVKSPDPKLFEQAIFIVREGAEQGGVTAEKVLAEARQAARHYVRRNSRWGRGLNRIPPAGWLAAGAVLATTLWSLAIYF